MGAGFVPASRTVQQTVVAVATATWKSRSEWDWALGSKRRSFTTVEPSWFSGDQLLLGARAAEESCDVRVPKKGPADGRRRSWEALLLWKFLAKLAKSNLEQTKIIIRFGYTGLNHRSLHSQSFKFNMKYTHIGQLVANWIITSVSMRMKVNFEIAPHFLHKPMDSKLYQKLSNDVVFGKHVCILILDLISWVE